VRTGVRAIREPGRTPKELQGSCARAEGGAGGAASESAPEKRSQGGVKAATESPNERTRSHRLPSSAINPGNVTRTAVLSARMLLDEVRDFPLNRHARRSDTAAMWMSLQSTLHEVVTDIAYTER